MSEFKRLDKLTDGLKEAREAFMKADIDVQGVMQKICDDISTYAKATIKDERIDVEAGTEHDGILYHKIMHTIARNFERPTFGLFLFNVVGRPDKISIIRKNIEGDNLDI